MTSGESARTTISVARPTDLFDSQGNAVGRLEPGATYQVLQAQQDWYETRDAAGRTGWVHAGSVIVGGPAGGRRYCSVDRPVDVLSPQDTSVVVGRLQPGTAYEIRQESEGWLLVSDGFAVEGWVRNDQVRIQEAAAPPVPPAPRPRPQPAPSPTVQVPAGGMPAWSQPDPNAAPIANLAAGTSLTAVGRQGAWVRVRATNGWEGWVDGRRLTSATPAQPAAPQPATPQPATPAPTAAPDAGAAAPIAVALRERPLPVLAAVVLLVASFVSWIGGFAGSANGFDIPISFLYSLTGTSTTLNFGILMLVLGGASAAVAILPQNERSAVLLRILGAAALAAGVIFIAQLARLFAQQNGWGTIVPDLFFRGFAIGPYLSIAAGITLVWLPHRIDLTER